MANLIKSEICEHHNVVPSWVIDQIGKEVVLIKSCGVFDNKFHPGETGVLYGIHFHVVYGEIVAYVMFDSDPYSEEHAVFFDYIQPKNDIEDEICWIKQGQPAQARARMSTS